jgi:hypothetical protein
VTVLAERDRDRRRGTLALTRGGDRNAPCPYRSHRGMVAEAVIGAAADPRVAATLRALSPVIDRWLSTSNAAAILGPAQAEVRVWLWACCVAYGWALDAEGHARG